MSGFSEKIVGSKSPPTQRQWDQVPVQVLTGFYSHMWRSLVAATQEVTSQLIALYHAWYRKECFSTSQGRETPVPKEMATTPVFLPGESQGRASLVGCPLWGLTELDTTEAT